MKKAILLAGIFGLSVCAFGQTDEKNLKRKADSLVEVRLNYIIRQFGDSVVLENHYNRSLQSIREEYRKIYLDSLRKEDLE